MSSDGQIEVSAELLASEFESPRGLLYLAIPSAAELSAIDATWPAGRSDADDVAWMWTANCRGSADRFALKTAPGKLVGLWATGSHRIKEHEGTRCYHLECMEVAPALRGQGLGAFMFSLACWRALDLELDGILFQALPERERFYRRLGGEIVFVPGWPTDEELLPFRFGRETMLSLKARVSAAGGRS